MAKVYGIDLGTTYSVIATLNENGMPEVIENYEEDSRTLASAVYFQESGDPVVGEAAKAQAEIEPERVVQFVKREIGKPDATIEEIEDAAKKAECHHFISTLPDGYNTIIGEDGGNISVGQKQLLTIARALLTNPQVMILDEATSSVDTKTESKIQVAMNTALQGRTSFVIAHRLSTIVNSDKILVMENGDIIEAGTHKELLKKNGAYAKLYNSQI